ncbi:hypothetical protein, partial [Acetobacter lovaniensis]|uniref:hypothetical protein n=1 Tax=Acetobacter lovaniensis TaxID=104100 RepID=UPI0037702640
MKALDIQGGLAKRRGEAVDESIRLVAPWEEEPPQHRTLFLEKPCRGTKPDIGGDPQEALTADRAREADSDGQRHAAGVCALRPGGGGV